ncbi:hypothetical protein FB562_1680 [Homoserinimonas aerilata]|uniref:TadE-like protein n=1 Tax=Homoserinimonas aerilata TaxID=1162970 RepID=A0A542YKG4_9MICO|nr:hypothetical protein [Homoserinimonas aerilata]TQL48583.1 hypothetical protein FB562_1680 [Homoserinimonas aerilata]
MRRWKRWSEALAAEEGSASLEFITAGMLLLVPLVYLVVALGSLQAAALAVEGGARQAARVYVDSVDSATARHRTEVAVRFALADYGIDDAAASVTIDCLPRPDACLTRQGTVTVTVSTTVALPLMPPVLGGGGLLAVPIEASAVQQVSRFGRER